MELGEIQSRGVKYSYTEPSTGVIKYASVDNFYCLSSIADRTDKQHPQYENCRIKHFYPMRDQMVRDGAQRCQSIQDRCDDLEMHPYIPEFKVFRDACFHGEGRDVPKYLKEYFRPFYGNRTTLRNDKYKFAFYIGMTIDCVLDDKGYFK